MKLETYAEQMQNLHQEAQLFAEQYPEQAQMLNLNELKDKDPYVERLLEGVAFLTSQIKEQIDADLPEISATFLQQFWPHLLKPFPSVTILQFNQNLRQIQTTKVIPKATQVLSEAVGPENTLCHFSTTTDLKINPLHIVDVDMLQTTAGNRKISIELQAEPGVDLQKCDLSKISFYINADDFDVASLIYALTDVDNRIKVCFPDVYGICEQNLPRNSLQFASINQDNMLLPQFGREQLALHLLHEYFSYRPKYQFVNLTGLDSLQLPNLCQRLVIEIDTAAVFSHKIHLQKDSLLLNCVPAINIYPDMSEPITLDHYRSEYQVIANTQAPQSVRTYAIEKVNAINANSGAREELYPLYSFNFREENCAYYAEQQTYDAKQNMRTKISVGGIAAGDNYRLSCEILASNGDYPRQYLKEGMLTQTLEPISFGKFTNISRPSSVLQSPAMQNYHWHLMENLALNLQSFDSADKLQRLLQGYDWSGRADNKKRILAIKEIELSTIEKVQRGALRVGNQFSILLNDDGYSNLGDAYVFARMLAQFLQLYADINSFVQVKVHFVKQATVWVWEK